MISPSSFIGKVKEIKVLGKDLFFLSISTPHETQVALPGQFAMVKGNWGSDPLLPRPLSILYAQKGHLELLFKVVGKGTKLLSKLSPSEELTLTYPLGNQFPEFSDPKKVLLLGGGIGIVPLYFYWKKFGGTLVMGAASINDLPRLQVDWKIATDDGSAGFHGNAVTYGEQLLKSDSYNTILSCGPLPMLKALSKSAKNHKKNLYVSLEAHMACGVGVCHGCAVQGSENNWLKVCKDGPIFPSEMVIL
jgi:dihydroorotate dehydrogenase electron transfer subunit